MDIIVPQVGESIVEAEIGEWFKKDGDYVEKDELIMELETEKVNVELNAEASGILKITAQQGETVKIGAVIGTIDEQAQATAASPVQEATSAPAPAAAPAPEPQTAPQTAAEAVDIVVPQVGESIVEAEIGEWFKKDGDFVNKDELIMELETEKVNVELNAEAAGILRISAQQGDIVKIGAVVGTIEPGAAQAATAAPAVAAEPAQPTAGAPMNPAVPKIAAERGIDPSTLTGSGRDGRVLVDDVPAGAPIQETAPEPAATPTPQASAPAAPAAAPADKGKRTKRVPMTQIRKKIAAHLMKARHETAMLTTFNEIDMSRVMGLRKAYKDSFLEKHGVGLGFMSFFVKACAEALLEYPEVNARIDGNDIIYHNYVDIGVAVGGKRGLVVPVIRDADKLSFDEIEKTIRVFAEKANSGKISLEDLEGGTFTISNGGIYGSVLSTPLLNPPQSGILGMHAIQDRAVVRDGEIVVRPIMNVALSYDHRIIDGKEAVGFLKQIKSYIDNPETLLLKV